MIKISTRGFCGKKKKGKIEGYYNHSDNYYDGMGKNVVENYFSKEDIYELISDRINDGEELQKEEDGIFLTDGLFCEYGYVYNEDDDTLEIYRGFFKKPQVFKKGYVSAGEEYHVHLVMVIDRKIHTKAQVIKAMDHYDEVMKEEDEHLETHPENDIINMCPGCLKPIENDRKYHNKSCEDKVVLKAI